MTVAPTSETILKSECSSRSPCKICVLPGTVVARPRRVGGEYALAEQAQMKCLQLDHFPEAD